MTNSNPTLHKAAKAALWFPVATAYLLLFSWSTSPLYVSEGIDSACFKTLGRLILNGGTPYTDLFDNKGPVLYFVNAAGLYLGDNLGILTLQAVGFTITLACIYRMLRMLIKPLAAMASMAVALFIYIVFIQEGNQCEEWTLYIATPALLYALRCLQGGRDPRGWGLGVALGLTLLIRPNDAVAQLGGLLLGLCAWLGYHGRWRAILRLCAEAAAGAAVVIAPVVLWFALRPGGLQGLWDGMFGINISYAGGIMSFGQHFQRVKLPLVLLVLTFLTMLWGSRAKQWLWLFAPVMVLFLLTLGPRLFQHYNIVLLPMLAVYTALFFCCRRDMVVVAIAVLMLTPQTLELRPLPRMARKLTIKRTLDALHPAQRQAADIALYAEAEQLFANMPAAERDSLWNANIYYINHSVLYHCGITQCNHNIYHFDEFTLDAPICEALPLWVVVDNGEPCADLADSTFAVRYQLVANTGRRDVWDASLYRRR